MTETTTRAPDLQGSAKAASSATPGQACCDTGTLSTCCDQESKSACCGTQTGQSAAPPPSCGCR